MRNIMYNAYADVKGSQKYNTITGRVYFRQTNMGVLVTAEIYGLPEQENSCNGNDGVFAFHIHEGESCSGNESDPFADAKTHYNPKNCPHPYHSGDLPPLFSNGGYAYMQVLTNRFRVAEITGRVVIIHSGTDDFTTQPSGNSGEKIACGKIIGNPGRMRL